jgi:hypothetical protein
MPTSVVCTGSPEFKRKPTAGNDDGLSQNQNRGDSCFTFVNETPLMSYDHSDPMGFELELETVRILPPISRRLIRARPPRAR